MAAETAMSPEDLIGEIAGQVTRIKKPGTIIDVKKEFTENLYPLLRLAIQTSTAIAADLHQRVALAEGVIAEYLTAQESMILPDMADAIHAVLGMGTDICRMVVASSAAEGAEKLTIDAKLLEAITEYHEASSKLKYALDEVTLDESEDEDEGDADDDLPAEEEGASASEESP